MKRKFAAIVTKEDDWYVSLNPETGVASQGTTIEAALQNLTEAVELYLEEAEDVPVAEDVILATIEV
ncbi:MAG TPA: type II toxin-antitoxin system HicB family antitoxin [Candidatus Saccharimonadales bacterium]|nr:type II toxin-antitoxin system HicB family antitoxin [Candidatus Saccharimonadales bacterium]